MTGSNRESGDGWGRDSRSRAPNRIRGPLKLGGLLVAAAVVAATGLALLFGSEPFSDCDKGERMTEVASQDALYRFTPRDGVEVSSDSSVVCDSDASLGLADRRIRYSGRKSDLISRYVAEKGPWASPKHSESDVDDLYCFDRRHEGLDRTITLTLYVPKAPPVDGPFVYEVDVAVSLYSKIGINSSDYHCE